MNSYTLAALPPAACAVAVAMVLRGQPTAWLGFAFTVLLTLALLRAGLRREEVVVEPTSGRVRWHGVAEPVGERAEIHLFGAGEGIDDPPDPAYRAVLVRPGRAELELLSATDPARVLSDLSQVLSVWPRPVVGHGLGLKPAGQPWHAGPGLSRLGPLATTRVACLDRRIPTVWLFFGMTVFVAAVVGWLIFAQIQRGGPVGLLGVVLGVLVTAVPATLALLALCAELRISASEGARFHVERRYPFGFKTSTSVAAADLGLWVLGSDPSRPAHLLVRSGDDLRSYRLASSAALELSQWLGRSAPNDVAPS